MSSLAVNTITDASGGNTATVNGYTPTASNMAGKNRIINGAMVIDQRNAGASVTQTTSTLYVTDRFAIRGSVTSKFTGQQSSVAPSGFVNSLLCTSSSAYSVGSAEAFFLAQFIEGNNVADLNWGTANAATVTLSFWVRSSLTGTFGGAISNYAGDRSYPFTYTISTANTWEQKSITIAGDTSGTWVTNNGGSMAVQFGLGVGSTYSGTAGAWAGALYRSATGATSVVGTNGATFYITGVQLEVGSVATPFEHRLYGTELALCQRYYQSFSYLHGTIVAVGTTFSTSAGAIPFNLYFPMRTAPSAITLPTVGSGNGQWSVLTPSGGYPGTFGSITANSASENNFRLDFSGFTSVFASTGQAAFLYSSGSSTTVVTASAEL